ncbi:MAG: AI-2E family transporter [Oscillospiraceae bacterium]|nr:AI-2E family transporter [Oscillospiraceae bacterium]
MQIQKKKEFLINIAYWAVIAAAVYLVCVYLVPISVPFFLGIPIAYLIVRISRRLHCNHKLVRIGLIIAIYGLIGLLITLAAAKGVSTVTGIILWIPEVYELKIVPIAEMCYSWFTETASHLDPALVSAMEVVLESLMTALKGMISTLSGLAVSTISGLATGVPNLILSMLAMIFSTVFVANDYEAIKSFAQKNLPQSVKKVLGSLWEYLTKTLFVVIRSYLIIMTLTFTELSIMFSMFGIEHAVLKAAIIAILDIMPVLGTGGIMIPWGIISLVLGYTKLGVELLFIYVVVTVVRNYVEPRIVGTQLGLHPIITLVSMFIGLRIFGFFGVFGLPVAISFLWKQRKEKLEGQSNPETEA